MSKLPYPQDDHRTHFEGCWRERNHHNCAVRRVEELERENQRLANICVELGERYVQTQKRCIAAEAQLAEARGQLEKASECIENLEEFVELLTSRD